MVWSSASAETCQQDQALFWDSLTKEEAAYLHQRIEREEGIVLGGRPWFFSPAFELPGFGQIYLQELEKLLCLPVTVRQHEEMLLLMTELADGDIDLLPGFIVTLERERDFEVSKPVTTSQLNLLTLNTDIQLTSLSELSGETLYISRGISDADKEHLSHFLKEKEINATVMEVDALYSNRHFIENGIILTLDIFRAAYAFGEPERLQVLPLDVSVPVSIAIRPDSPLLRRIIDKVLDSGLRSRLELLWLRYQAKTRYNKLLTLLTPVERQRLLQLNTRPIVDDGPSQLFFPLGASIGDYSWALRFMAYSLGFEVLTQQQAQTQDQPIYGSELFGTGLDLLMTTDSKFTTPRLTEPLFDITLLLVSHENQSLRNVREIGTIEGWLIGSTNLAKKLIPMVNIRYFVNLEEMLRAFVDRKIQHILLPREVFTAFLEDQPQIQSSVIAQGQARIQVPEPWLPIKSSVNMVLTKLTPKHKTIDIWKKGLERRRNAWQENQRKQLVEKTLTSLLVWGMYCGIALLFLYLLWDKRRMFRLSRQDLLTGCLNRHALAELHDDKPLARKGWLRAAIGVNIKELQTINQTHGDQGGDNVLRDCARLLRQTFGKRQIYRSAGEYFIYLPATATDLDRNFTRYLKKLDALRQQTEVGNEQCPGYGFRLGAARADQLELPSADLSQLVHAINIALLEAKKDSRQHWRQCDQALLKRFNRPRELAAQLDQAFAEEQIIPYYQPKVDLGHNRPVGAEALARWLHPTEGMISPAEFVLLLENRYEIHLLDWHIAKTAIRFTAQGLQQGKLGDEFTMSFNLSPRTFLKSDVITNLTMLLNEYKIAPHHLEIEITETCFSGDIPDLQNTLTQLKALGVRLALDDFTAGFSSVTMLTELDIDTVKLDRSLITPVEQGNKRAELVCTGLIRMLKTTGQHLIAEGVETPEACSFLREQGVNVVQGFVFSKPLPSDQFLDYRPPLSKAENQ